MALLPGPAVEVRLGLTRMLHALDDERETLKSSRDDDRVLDVLLEMDDLELVILRALESFEPPSGSA